MSPDRRKRQHGRFYTEGNPFVLAPFKKWAKKIGLATKAVLEPFAGANHIIRALQQEGYAKNFASFDIDPQHPEVKKRNTLTAFPNGYDVCVTNPPWLAKNSAHRRGLAFPTTKYDDLYKHALELCVSNCSYVAAIIPATFLQSGLFLGRLESVIVLHDKNMFLDTDNPVCLALFVPDSKKVSIYHDSTYVGELESLKVHIPTPRQKKELTFNHPRGELGFIAIDGTEKSSIRFCDVKEIGDYPIKVSSRMITRIKGDVAVDQQIIKKLNQQVAAFREETSDVFLTPFKGLRKDGRYRRRMDYRLARIFIDTYA